MQSPFGMLLGAESIWDAAGTRQEKLLGSRAKTRTDTRAVVIPFSRGPSQSDIKPGAPALQADSLWSEPPGKPQLRIITIQKLWIMGKTFNYHLYTCGFKCQVSPNIFIYVGLPITYLFLKYLRALKKKKSHCFKVNQSFTN